METLEQYFSRADTPEAGSPVGVAMARLIEHVPAISPEKARVIVQQATYHGPKSLTQAKAA